MKRAFMLSGLIGLSLIWNACEKSSVPDVVQPTQAGQPTRKVEPDCIPCQGGSPPVTPAPPMTDDQLEAAGNALGCALATDNGGAPVDQIIGYNPDGTPIVGPNAIYSVFSNTVNNASWPAIYREGVEEGWSRCFSLGKKAGNCPTIQVISNTQDQIGESKWVSVNYCTWIAGGEAAPGPPK